MQLYLKLLTVGLLLAASLAQGATPVDVTPSRDYLNFCASCHGVKGDGNGKAARFLFPKPRNFADSPIQFSTTANRIASSTDIRNTILKGVPNSSMTAWRSLTTEQLDTLVADIAQFRLAGAKARYLTLLQTTGDATSADGLELTNRQQNEMQLYLEKETTPGLVWTLPKSPMLESSTSVGRELYLKQNCHKCHGEDARGSYGLDMVGEFGFPTFARDLIREPYKYGSDKESIARVIRLGINGTKMPASTTLTAAELSELAEFILSIRAPRTAPLTNAQRYQRAIGTLPKSP